MNIVSILQAHRDIAVMQPTDAVAALNVKNIPREDHSLYTFRELTNRYGTTFAATALGGLKAAAASNPLLDAAYQAIATTGLDFANPITQGMIDQLQAAGAWDSITASQLKAIGITDISLVEQMNSIGDTATEDDFNNALIELNRIDLLTQIDQARGQVANGTITTLDAFKAAL